MQFMKKYNSGVFLHLYYCSITQKEMFVKEKYAQFLLKTARNLKIEC